MAGLGPSPATVEEKPSIFEVLAVESLTTGLRQAFRHFTKVLAENFPHKFGSLFQYFEETYTLIDFVFQFVHFKLHGASFAERFYNLLRIPDARDHLIPTRRVLVIVSVLTLFPYVRFQLEHIFKSIKEKEYDGTLNVYKDGVKKLALFYTSVYPWLHFLWESTLCLYFMSYALNKLDYHSPLFHIASTKLISSNSDDFQQDRLQHLAGNNRLKQSLWKIAEVGVGGITLGVATGAYVLQFLGWWYSQDGGTRALYPMPVPPPPPKWPTERPPNVCPLCLKKRTNDTALSSSGFVFCYPCIFNYVHEQKRCPVTGYPATLDELIKIYHQDTEM